MKFLHLSDIHFRKNYQTDTFTANFFKEKYYPENQLEKLFLQVDVTQYDFMIITGDLVHEGHAEDYVALRKVLKKYLGNVPYFYCRGNHDIRNEFLKGMAAQANKEGDYIAKQEINGLRIISLDSAQEGEHEGVISVQQFETLAQYLEQPAEKGTLLLLHHPLVWAEEHIATKVPQGFMELVQQSDIIGIFVGHIHQNTVLPYGNKLQYMSEAIAFGVDEYRDKSIFINRTGYSSYILENKQLYAYHHLLTPIQTIVGGVTKPL